MLLVWSSKPPWERNVHEVRKTDPESPFSGDGERGRPAGSWNTEGPGRS